MANIVLRDANNYSAMASLSIPIIQTAPADLDICWTDLVTDLQCHDVSPVDDIDNVMLVRIVHLTEAEVQAQLAEGELPMANIAGYLEFRPSGATCTKLSELSFGGTRIDVVEEYVEDTGYTYLLLFSTGTRAGVGARSMVFLRPTAASTTTQVAAPAACGRLDFSADLMSPTPVDVPEAGPWVVGWNDLTRDGAGNPIKFGSIDDLILGYYEGETVAGLQSKIFDIELIATKLWDLSLTSARTANLADAKERGTGAAFSGFGGAAPGVWMLGLTCETCSNPAPILLSILNPVPGGP